MQHPRSDPSKMPAPIVPLLLLLLGAASQAAPTTYDQRQDGDVNVKVDLDNFVVLIARPISALDVFGAVGQLLADTKNAQFAEPKESAELSRGNPPAAGLEAEQQQQQQQQQSTAGPSTNEAQQNPPAKPDTDGLGLEERSPAAALMVQQQVLADAEKAARSLEQPLLRTKPHKESKPEKDKHKPSVNKYKLVEVVEEPQSLRLVGDSVENCGPGRSRDRLGICQEDQ